VRVAIVDTYYEQLLGELYAAEPALAERSYDEQHARLMDMCFGTSDAYSRELRALGHEATDLVANCLPLQQAWVREHGSLALKASVRWPRNIARRILLAQLEQFHPDVVYFQELSVLDRASLDALRAGGMFVAGQIASPLPPERQLRGYDLILTSFSHWVGQLPVPTEYLAIGFDTKVLHALRARGATPDADVERPLDVVFVGSVNAEVHTTRVQTLERLCETVDLAVWGYGAETLALGSRLRARVRGHAWGIDMYATLSRAKIALNAHIDLADGHANNMRLFEATGVGALLVTDAAPNLTDFFEPGREVVAYRSGDQLPGLVRRWLDDDAGRMAVAAAGQQRTLREHTYADRIGRLVEILEPRVR
jgi:spore maturation protein CgeB